MEKVTLGKVSADITGISFLAVLLLFMSPHSVPKSNNVLSHNQLDSAVAEQCYLSRAKVPRLCVNGNWSFGVVLTGYPAIPSH
jgi:hypothetical protein